MQFEEFALKTNILAFSSRSKAKAKPRRRTSVCSSTRTVFICKRSWTDIEPETYLPVAYQVSKKLSTLLRHGHLPSEEVHLSHRMCNQFTLHHKFRIDTGRSTFEQTTDSIL